MTFHHPGSFERGTVRPTGSSTTSVDGSGWTHPAAFWMSTSTRGVLQVVDEVLTVPPICSERQVVRVSRTSTR